MVRRTYQRSAFSHLYIYLLGTGACVIAQHILKMPMSMRDHELLSKLAISAVSSPSPQPNPWIFAANLYVVQIAPAHRD